MSRDTISDFLTTIRNGIMAAHPFVMVPFSVLKFDVAKILKDEGFIRDAILVEENGRKQVKIFLKYVDGESVIHELTRVSKSARRAYAGFRELKPVIGGLGIAILTTNQGVMTNKKAKDLSIGGEIICTVW